jgi:hypothetical protein
LSSFKLGSLVLEVRFEVRLRLGESSSKSKWGNLPGEFGLRFDRFRIFPGVSLSGSVTERVFSNFER